ncbi:unnamed protein product [Ceratitis capitata]|uniref:(Mediterranean fruit fly) hypothetical protein n=1 Tax=Ceratitis capitata TaxID=7213 RepID=A0A811U4L3_CERCA|nr:unnamed protein product [Ceratitis capitata]
MNSLLEAFIKDFEENGPGSVGPDLDKGSKLMDQYGAKLNKYEERRVELSNAEKLFDMPMADYNDFSRIKSDYEGMILVYKLYKSYKTGREVWSKTLWADLDPQILTDGIESYMKEFRKLPKQSHNLGSNNKKLTLASSLQLIFDSLTPYFAKLYFGLFLIN